MIKACFSNCIIMFRVPSSPRKGARQLNALDARKMPRYRILYNKNAIFMFDLRSKSVPKPPFSMFSPPSSSESIKKGK